MEKKNANPRPSPAQGPRSPILAPNAVENPAYRGKSDSPKPLKSPANAPHSPGMGVRGFPLTSALEWLVRCLRHDGGSDPFFSINSLSCDFIFGRCMGKILLTSKKDLKPVTSSVGTISVNCNSK